jgi:hypothetical protein
MVDPGGKVAGVAADVPVSFDVDDESLPQPAITVAAASTANSSLLRMVLLGGVAGCSLNG